jgi:hypothetical protein
MTRETQFTEVAENNVVTDVVPTTAATEEEAIVAGRKPEAAFADCELNEILMNASANKETVTSKARNDF